MCLQRRTWMRLRIWAFIILFGVSLVLFLSNWGWSMGLALAGQSQDGINAVASERIANNMWRLDQMGVRVSVLEGKVDKINWLLGMLSAQLFIKLLELWHKRPGSQHPPSIRERRDTGHGRDFSDGD